MAIPDLGPGCFVPPPEKVYLKNQCLRNDNLRIAFFKQSIFKNSLFSNINF